MSIERLSLEARILYTAFAVFLLVGELTAGWLYVDDGLGVRAGAARSVYLGDEPRADVGADVGGGPALEMPVVVDAAAPMRFEKPARQIVETLHFHLFSVPVCLLIVGHLFMMCSLSTRTKAWVLGGASIATLVHVVAPSLVRFGSARLAVVVFPSAIAMAVSWAFLTLWPIWEMWRPVTTLRAPQE